MTAMDERRLEKLAGYATTMARSWIDAREKVAIFVACSRRSCAGARALRTERSRTTFWRRRCCSI